MKSFFYKSLFVACVSTAVSDAFSLYDSAPIVGLPESYNLRYEASVRFGYDSNVNWSDRNEDGSAYVNASVGARYADMESVSKLNYSVRLGATQYFGVESNSAVAETRGDCRLTAGMVHAFGPSDTLSSSLKVTYSPQPDYSDGYSPAYSLGDMLSSSLVNLYSHALDSRWSVNGSVSFSSINYMEDVERCDDRYYIQTGVGAQYKESSLLTYKVDLRYARELREEGLDSDRLSMTVGVQRALDPFSSIGANAGVQVRMFSSESKFSPCADFSYRRKMSEGLNARVFCSLSDENVGTSTVYRGMNQTYLTNMAVRFGANLSYVLSPDVSYTFGTAFVVNNYSDSNVGAEDYTTYRYDINGGLIYSFTPSLSGSLNVSYSFLSREYERMEGIDVSRWNVSVGLVYNF